MIPPTHPEGTPLGTFELVSGGSIDITATSIMNARDDFGEQVYVRCRNCAAKCVHHVDLVAHWGAQPIVCEKCSREFDERFAQQDEHSGGKRLARWQEICGVYAQNSWRNQQFRQSMSKVREKWDGTKSLIIRGETGVAKTRCMCEALGEHYKRGENVLVLFSEDIREAASSGQARWAKLRDWSQVDLLGIDDPFFSGMASENQIAFVKDLIDRRQRHDKKFIITTQIGGAEIAEANNKYKNTDKSSMEQVNALVRRLREQCAGVTLKPHNRENTHNPTHQ